jgi:YfiH family protein
MALFIPNWPGLPDHVGLAMTERRGGVSAAPYDDGVGGGGFNLGMHVNDQPASVAHNRAQLVRLLPAEPAWLTQVHGTRVVDAAQVNADHCDADASVTNQSGVVCAIMTADCLPVLFCDRAGRVVGAAHAGWRGLHAGVLENTVHAMQSMGANDIMAWLGPAIGPSQFEVGQEVVDAFVDQDPAVQCCFSPVLGQANKFLADIYALARHRLQAVGVKDISGGDYCTVLEKTRFFSYRRDKTTGRMAALIWLKTRV